MKNSTIIKIDIKGFNKQAKSENDEETADYLLNYYQAVWEVISGYGWRFIKSIGDCVMISADSNTENIPKLFETLSKAYTISLCHRQCRFVEKQISIGQYSCMDIFGKDINNLFLCDALTTKLG